MEMNPYAMPNEEIDLTGILRDGNLLVVAHGVKLPDRCVFTNETDRTARHVADDWGNAGRAKNVRGFRFHYAARIPLWGSVVAVALIAILTLSVWWFEPAWSGCCAVVAIAAAMIRQATQPQLRVVKQIEGRWWVSGCCSEFLDGLDAPAFSDQHWPSSDQSNFRLEPRGS